METSIRGGRTATRWSSRPAKKLADQFDQYVVGGKHVRGRATLGENIADLGGIVLGYEAFKKTEQFKRGEQLNGLTPISASSSATRWPGWGHGDPMWRADDVRVTIW